MAQLGKGAAFGRQKSLVQIQLSRPGCSAAWLARVLWEQEARGSNPRSPTRGSLVKSESQPVEARQVPGRFRGEPPRRTRPMARTPAFQAGYTGSNPVCGSDALQE
jgi:hypothetical protein